MYIKQVDSPQGTRDQILSVAARLFSERGFANVSIRDICDVAGVTPPTIYHYFGNKDLLFQAVIRKTLSLKDFRIALLSAISEESNPENQLAVFIKFYLVHFPRGFFNPGMFLQDTTNLSNVSTERVMEEFEAINDISRKIIQDGIASKVFKDLDLELTSVYLMNLLMSFVLGEVHYFQNVDFSKASAVIIDLFINGVHQKVSIESKESLNANAAA
jgi:AcrR family transcriptional regulator